MIDRVEAWLRKARRSISRSEWSARRLSLSLSERTEAHAGLFLIHVPALSLARVQEELRAGHLPFFKRLLAVEGYGLHPLSGASSVSAAELEARFFYGSTAGAEITQAAVSDQPSAAGLEQQLSGQAGGLLQGGSQYGGVFSGGSSHTHFCVAKPGWGDLFPADSAWLRAAVLLGHSACFVRAAAHGAAHALKALVESRRSGPFREKSIEARQSTINDLRHAVLYRDLAVVGAAIDAARGLPVVHINFEGYALQLRRRGPAAVYTNFLLAGIERAIRSAWLSARRSARRDYDVWVYSTVPFQEIVPFQETVPLQETATQELASAGEPPPMTARQEQERAAPFALLPIDAPVAISNGAVELPALREAALHVLGRAPLPAAARPLAAQVRSTLRVMTYNVHSCVGMDGKLSPARIARVIARCQPDVVALQELDVGRARTGAVDQAQAIARELQMEFHFNPAISLAEELYGDAVLSRFPMRLRRAAALPGLPDRPELEPRGAVWVTLEVEGREIQLLNTHLGLVGQERVRQVDALLGPEWLAHPECQGRTILCGDFNALPGSRVCRALSGRLADAQLSLNGHRPKHTFFARYPIGRIDHIFVSPGFEVLAVDVPRNDLIRRASDHLPLLVELRALEGL